MSNRKGKTLSVVQAREGPSLPELNICQFTACGLQFSGARLATWMSTYRNPGPDSGFQPSRSTASIDDMSVAIVAAT